MNKKLFPWIAIGLGLVLVSALFFSGAATGTKEYALPLLTMLFMSELGALVTGAGAFIGIQLWLQKRNNVSLLLAGIVSAVLAMSLLLLGLNLWNANQLN
jgi:hypothetical protein